MVLSANKTPKYSCFNISKNAELYADFKTVKKVAQNGRKKSYWQKCDGKMYFLHFHSCSSNWFPSFFDILFDFSPFSQKISKSLHSTGHVSAAVPRYATLILTFICLAGELLLGAEDHHPVRPAAVQGGGRQAEVHLQADGQGQKGGSSFFSLSIFPLLVFS